MRIRTLLTTCLALCLSAPLSALASADKEAAIHQAIIERLQQARDDFEYGPVTRTPLPGVYRVPIIGGPMLYTTAAGDFAIAGEMYQVLPGELVNMAEQERIEERRELLATLDTDDMIIFPASGETKAVINVFTDVDCGYCRRLHEEVPDLNKHGVEVRYLAFPRAGGGTPTHDKMVRAWCSSDQQKAITDLKQGKNIKGELCEDNPVMEQFELGRQFGVTGTPSLVLADGTMIPGYRPWKDLLEVLGL